MYGKHFESMYTGSLVGKGPVVFALMGYVIANTHHSTIELNPGLLGYTFGCEESDVLKAIDFLCAPDPRSRSREKEGRRLIKEGSFQYFVVNHEKYRKMRNQEDRREQNRRAQEKYRTKKRTLMPNREPAYLAAEERGATEDEKDAIITSTLPKHLQ